MGMGKIVPGVWLARSLEVRVSRNRRRRLRGAEFEARAGGGASISSNSTVSNSDYRLAVEFDGFSIVTIDLSSNSTSFR